MRNSEGTHTRRPLTRARTRARTCAHARNTCERDAMPSMRRRQTDRPTACNVRCTAIRSARAPPPAPHQVKRPMGFTPDAHAAFRRALRVELRWAGRPHCTRCERRLGRRALATRHGTSRPLRWPPPTACRMMPAVCRHSRARCRSSPTDPVASAHARLHARARAHTHTHLARPETDTDACAHAHRDCECEAIMAVSALRPKRKRAHGPREGRVSAERPRYREKKSPDGPGSSRGRTTTGGREWAGVSTPSTPERRKARTAAGAPVRLPLV